MWLRLPSEIEVRVLILRGFPLVHAVRSALLLLLPLGHEVAHHHHHRNVIISLLSWYLLLKHGVLTSRIGS